jgi:hypothetical protein
MELFSAMLRAVLPVHRPVASKALAALRNDRSRATIVPTSGGHDQESREIQHLIAATLIFVSESHWKGWEIQPSPFPHKIPNVQFAIHNLQFELYHSKFTIYNSQAAIPKTRFQLPSLRGPMSNSQFACHNLQCALHNSQFPISLFQSAISNSPFAIYN